MMHLAGALSHPWGPPQGCSRRRPDGRNPTVEKRVLVSACKGGNRTCSGLTDGQLFSSAICVQRRARCTRESAKALKGGAPRVSSLLSRRHLLGGHVALKHFIRRAREEEIGHLQPSGASDSSVSILRSVSAVGVVTLVCKMLGLIREVFIAASFGVGWVRIHLLTLSLSLDKSFAGHCLSDASVW